MQVLMGQAALQFAQRLAANPKSVYSMKEAAIIAGSLPTAYRRMNALKAMGMAQSSRGYFTLNTSVLYQPPYIIERLLPSLAALKRGRRFGRYYGESDIKFVMENIPNELITLDYKAWELTNFQYPVDLYVYVREVEKTVNSLRENGFSEGKKGRVVILPMLGDFHNKIERVYLDCIAKGGRSLQDAVAIELLHGDKLNIRGSFPIELVRKVQEDMVKPALEA